MCFKLRTVIILGIVTHVIAWRPFTVKHLNASTEVFHPDVLDVILKTKNESFFDLQLNIARRISQFFIDFEVLQDSGDGAYDLVRMNKTFDVCMFLNNRKSNVIFDIIYRIVSDYGDLPKKCPILKNRYDLVNVFVDPEKLPPFMPDYRARVSGVAWNMQNNGKKIIFVKFKLVVVVERSFKINGN